MPCPPVKRDARNHATYLSAEKRGRPPSPSPQGGTASNIELCECRSQLSRSKHTIPRASASPPIARTNLRATPACFFVEYLLQSDKLPLWNLARSRSAAPRRQLTAGGFRGPLRPSKQPASGQARFRRPARPSHRGFAIEPGVHDTLATPSQRPGTEGLVTLDLATAGRSARRSPTTRDPPSAGPTAV